MEISRKYTFSAAHRITNHPKCGRLHGHNYTVEVFLSGNLVRGMVLDYGTLDIVVKPVIEQLDHRYIVSKNNSKDPADPWCHYSGTAQIHWFVLLPKEESTAELLASWLAEKITQGIQELPEWDGIMYVSKIIVQETDKSYAIWVPED